MATFRLTTTQCSFNQSFGAEIVRVVITFGSALYAGQSMTCTASGTYDSGTFCAFGTRPRSGVSSTIVLTTDNIAELLVSRGFGWLGIAFQTLAGLVIDVAGLCGVGPPQVPQINTSLLEASMDERLLVFKRILWDNFCECVPGAPSPTPYPPYASPEPVTWPVAPTFPCDPADLCASLEAIRSDLNALIGTVAAQKTLVELLQRYSLPFAYISGAAHSNLTGEGTFQVSRLVGMQITATAIPPTQRALRGNPPYLLDLGWLSITDANGMLEEKRLTRQFLLWLPRLMPTALHFNYDLFDGVTVRAVELQAEP